MTVVRTLAIDVGASGIKFTVLADDAHQPAADVRRVDTPRPATPDAVIAAIVAVARGMGPYDRVGMGFPGIVVDDAALNAPNMDGDWGGVPLGGRLTEALGCPVRVANDADVAGLGVLATVAGAGRGVELVITLGTGMGSALFLDGVLVPNLEMGHHPFADGRHYEGWLGMAGLDELGVDAWRVRLAAALAQLRATFSPRTIYIGGGNARLVRENELLPGTTIVGNLPGLLGAAGLWPAK